MMMKMLHKSPETLLFHRIQHGCRIIRAADKGGTGGSLETQIQSHLFIAVKGLGADVFLHPQVLL